MNKRLIKQSVIASNGTIKGKTRKIDRMHVGMWQIMYINAVVCYNLAYNIVAVVGRTKKKMSTNK